MLRVVLLFVGSVNDVSGGDDVVVIFLCIFENPVVYDFFESYFERGRA